uniref:Retrotransposon protein, putative, Ty3-gypsy subclass n=1 Tax=Oryza sativa subsp. japonica TaxID=39947 RepID=Q109Z7_ORYSJ|nr:retrotransposon protein, putative, Ty3-gypsy subclass [Oryza sativa Japonica Group]
MAIKDRFTGNPGRLTVLTTSGSGLLWIYPASYLLFWYDLLSTVDSTQPCSLFPHTRAEDLPSWSCLIELITSVILQCVAEAGTASGGFTGVTTRRGRIEEGRLPCAQPGYRSGQTPVAREWRNGVGVGLVSVEVVEERLMVAAATPSPREDLMARRAVSPLQSNRGRRSTAPPAQGSGEVLRQPEAEEEAQQGRAGEPQPELRSHGGEGSSSGHQP